MKKKKKIKVWNVIENNLIYEIQGHQDVITTVTWDSSSKFFATGGYDSKVKVWNSSDSNYLSESLNINYGNEVITSLKFNPSGKNLAVGTHNSLIKVKINY